MASVTCDWRKPHSDTRGERERESVNIAGGMGEGSGRRL